MALNGLQKDIVLYSQDDINFIGYKIYKKYVNLDEPNDFVEYMHELLLPHFLYCADELRTNEYYFIHRIFQEYFAAKRLACLFLSLENREQFIKIMSEHLYNPHFQLVWPFVAGLLKDESSALNDFIEILKTELKDMTGINDIRHIIHIFEQTELSPNLNSSYKNWALQQIKTWLTSDYAYHLIESLSKSPFLYIVGKIKDFLLAPIKINDNENIKKTLENIPKFIQIDSSIPDILFNLASKKPEMFFQVFQVLSRMFFYKKSSKFCEKFTALFCKYSNNYNIANTYRIDCLNEIIANLSYSNINAAILLNIQLGKILRADDYSEWLDNFRTISSINFKKTLTALFDNIEKLTCVISDII